MHDKCSGLESSDTHLPAGSIHGKIVFHESSSLVPKTLGFAVLKHLRLPVRKGRRVSLVAPAVKNLLVSAGHLRDLGWIPGSGIDPLEEEMATHSSILACRIPRTEERGGLQSNMNV